MRSVIRNAQERVKATIAPPGHDGWLPQSQDPWRYIDGLGAVIRAKSAEDEHLTWGILGAALQGLEDCVLQNDWFQETAFQTFDGDWGHVGDGELLRYRRTSPIYRTAVS